MDDSSRNAPVRVPKVPGTSAGPDPLIGRVINDRFKVVGLIARGGMGKVYRAEQAPLGRLVALKVLNPNYTGDNDPEFHKRFFLEASIASKLTHPNTVTVFDYGRTDDDIYYIAMELLEGRTLHRALRDSGPLSGDRVMHIGRQICRSLREAHQLGVIHRDLKPANIYLVEHGDETDFVKVLDFGLVKNVEENGEDLTQAGLFMGSPKYMSPEQIRGDAVDARVDVYGLGVIMYEMLTGKVPFDRASSVNILMAHIQEEVPEFSVTNPDVVVPPALERVVLRCMAKDTAERYVSMDAVLGALKESAGLSPLVSGEHRISTELDSSSGLSLPPSSTDADLAGLQPQGDLLGNDADSTAGREPVKRTLSAGPSRRGPALAVLGALVAVGVLSLYYKRGHEVIEVPTPGSAVGDVPTIQPRVPGAPASVGETEQIPSPVEEVAVPALRSVLVTLDSTPAGAFVQVGQERYGPTPVEIKWTGSEAEVGREVRFVFRREGYQERIVTRIIEGDQLRVDAAALEPVPAVPPRAAPRRPRGRVRTVRKPRPSTAPSVASPKPEPPGPAPVGGPPLKGYKAEPY